MDATTVTLNIAPEWFWGIVWALGLAIASAMVFAATSPRPARKPAELLPSLIIAARVLLPLWLIVLCAVLYGLWLVIYDFRSELQGDNLRWHVLALVGLITALGGVISAPLALLRVFTTERQTRAAEDGLLAERIVKAVEQLGSDKVAVRVGAIYALESIMQDSEANRNRMWSILNAFLKNEQKSIPSVGQEDDPPELQQDLQAALTVITRQRPGHD